MCCAGNSHVLVTFFHKFAEARCYQGFGVVLLPPSLSHSFGCQHGREEQAELHMFQACSEASHSLLVSLPPLYLRFAKLQKKIGGAQHM